MNLIREINYTKVLFAHYEEHETYIELEYNGDVLSIPMNGGGDGWHYESKFIIEHELKDWITQNNINCNIETICYNIRKKINQKNYDRVDAYYNNEVIKEEADYANNECRN